jgi:NADH:ubiquinone oxidoreductase subunit F (NADH-binding)
MLAGEALPDDRQRLERLAMLMQTASLCGLGMSVNKPVHSALQHFSDYFEARKTPPRSGAKL